MHGDLRLSNIYVRQGVADGTPATDADFMFVGFDHAGHDTAARYPGWVSSEAAQLDGVGPLRSITRDLDRSMLLTNLRAAAAAVPA